MAKYLSQEWLDEYRALAKDQPAREGATAHVQYVITDGPDGTVRYHWSVVDGRLIDAQLGELPDPDFTWTATYETQASIQRGDRKQATRIINLILLHIYSAGAERSELLKGLLLELVVMMSRAAVEAGAPQSEVLGLRYRHLTELAAISDDEQLSQWLKEAVVRSAVTRAQPIVLTGLAAMLGAFFILDDPIFNGLAISLIFGILVSTLLTLVVIPLLYFVAYRHAPLNDTRSAS